MDRDFYTDSFERLLKEKSDEFRMYPIKRVWHSIYNNLYPGRRYPSAIMSITITAAIGLISFLNSNHLKTSSVINLGNSTTSVPASNLLVSSVNKISVSPGSIAHENNLLTEFKNASSSDNKNLNENNNILIKNKSFDERQLFVHHAINQLQNSNNSNVIIIKTSGIDNKSASTEVVENSTEKSAIKSSIAKSTSTDNYSMNDQHFSKKWADKLVWQIYASPYVAYGEGYMPKTNSVQGQDNNNSNFDNSSIGLEAGTAMQYSLSGLIKLKAGVQFNYASYNMEAYQNEFNSEMPDIIPKTGFSNNGISPVTLHNEMYQFSLPVGVEFKLLQKNNLQWNAGATIQPSFIAGGNTYLLSSDAHNFIDESSALNKWNFNAGFETFITYKINGLTWQFGPQVRYQFSSIYSKAYTPVDEKFANFGVKIGVSKVLR